MRSELERLPAPNYLYKVALPKLPEQPFKSDSLFIEDRADRDAMSSAQRERENEEERKRRSLVVQHALPRPKRLNVEMRMNADCVENAEMDELIKQEMLDLMYLDDLHSKKTQNLLLRKREFADEELLAAKAAMENEAQRLRECAQKEDEDEDEDEEDDAECLFIPRLKRFGFVDGDGDGDQIGDGLDAKKQEFNVLFEQIAAHKKKVDGIERKIGIKMNGYHQIGQQLLAKNGSLRKQLIEMHDELRIYRDLKQKEAVIIPQRIRKWETLIEREKQRQSALQNEYEKVKKMHDSLLR